MIGENQFVLKRWMNQFIASGDKINPTGLVTVQPHNNSNRQHCKIGIWIVEKKTSEQMREKCNNNISQCKHKSHLFLYLSRSFLKYINVYFRVSFQCMFFCCCFSLLRSRLKITICIAYIYINAAICESQHFFCSKKVEWRTVYTHMMMPEYAREREREGEMDILKTSHGNICWSDSNPFI